MTDHPIWPTVMKHGVDALAVGIAATTIVQLLPPIAAAFTIVVAALRIYDWIEGRIKKNKEKKNGLVD